MTMISKIEIQNFKSLEGLELECSNLNFFSGLNGMGKSSILQALLLLRQSFEKGYLEKYGLTLKGDLVNIGVGKDALYQYADKEEMVFKLSFDGDEGGIKYAWILVYQLNKENEEYKYYDSDVIPFAEDFTPPQGLETLPLFNTKFQYLSAERWVKEHYERSDYQVVQKRNLGKHGEFTPHFLVHYGPQKAEEINDKLLYPGTTIKTLEYQVTAWMNEISPGTVVKTEKIKGVDAIKLSYEFTNENERTDEMSPINVGFGITYVLPVIVALLSAKLGDIIIIENPEAHLHPKGQSVIGRLMALTAQQGVQIFVESHSDHILNGICIAIHNGQLKKDLAKLYFLHKKHNSIQTLKYEIFVNQNGKIDDRVLREIGIEGFFDQITKDLDIILFTPSQDQ